eukprot:UN09945
MMFFSYVFENHQLKACHSLRNVHLMLNVHDDHHHNIEQMVILYLITCFCDDDDHCLVVKKLKNHPYYHLVQLFVVNSYLRGNHFVDLVWLH